MRAPTSGLHNALAWVISDLIVCLRKYLCFNCGGEWRADALWGKETISTIEKGSEEDWAERYATTSRPDRVPVGDSAICVLKMVPAAWESIAWCGSIRV